MKVANEFHRVALEEGMLNRAASSQTLKKL